MSLSRTLQRTVPRISTTLGLCTRHLCIPHPRRIHASSTSRNSSFTNILADENPPPVQVKSITNQGINLADGLMIPSACIFLEGKVYLWDVPSTLWAEWTKDHFEIFETVIPRPGTLLVLHDYFSCSSHTAHRNPFARNWPHIIADPVAIAILSESTWHSSRCHGHGTRLSCTPRNNSMELVEERLLDIQHPLRGRPPCRRCIAANLLTFLEEITEFYPLTTSTSCSGYKRQGSSSSSKSSTALRLPFLTLDIGVTSSSIGRSSKSSSSTLGCVYVTGSTSPEAYGGGKEEKNNHYIGQFPSNDM